MDPHCWNSENTNEDAFSELFLSMQSGDFEVSKIYQLFLVNGGVAYASIFFVPSPADKYKKKSIF